MNPKCFYGNKITKHTISPSQYYITSGMPPLPSHLYFTHLRAQNKTPTPSQLHLLPYLDALTTTSPTNRVKKGLYIHGPPGTGKTMLLNTLAIASFPPQPPKYFWQHPQPYTVHKKHYAEIIVQQQRKELDVTNKILCIDEVNVTDIADAMTFREIMESVMEKQNTVLVATSNREPDGILTLLLFLGRRFANRWHCIDRRLTYAE